MQKKNKLFKQYYNKILFEGILKTVLCELVAGFAADFLVAAISWFVGYDGGLWLSIGIGAGVAIIAGLILYFFKFRPTTQEIARRVDRLGLEERVITMLELENDQSYIAMRQREDTKRCLNEISAKSLKLMLSNVVIVAVIVSMIMSGSMTTVVVLAKEDIIDYGNEIINPSEEDEDVVAVSYFIDEGGEIVGEADQIFTKGGDATPVTAVAIDGWMFLEWSDGITEPGRHDLAVTESFEVFAIFEEIAESGDVEGDGGLSEDDSEQEGDKANDAPSNGNGAGGKWEDKNQIINGNKFYRDEVDYYYELAMEILANGGEIPDDLREFIEKYYDSI